MTFTTLREKRTVKCTATILSKEIFIMSVTSIMTIVENDNLQFYKKTFLPRDAL